MHCEMRFFDLSVVTRVVSVLGIWVGVLRGVTVLGARRTRDFWVMSYAPTVFSLFARSQRCRSVPVRRPIASAMSHSFEAVSRRFVPKSVPKSATGEHLGGRVRERLLTDLGELLTGVRDSHTVSKE